MTKNTKSHAKDYLLEYKAKKDTPKWLASLIRKVIDTNAKISDEDKNDIFQELLKDNEIDTEQNTAKIKNVSVVNQTEIISNSTPQKLTLQKITHIKGVNALILNQSITLSPACTVFFGLNGTGKSGYFRIIHELAGGIKSRDILGNIHKQGDGLEVDVDFLLDDKTQNPFKWEDKSLRGIVPFNQIRVFDSEYLPIFLNERESSVNIEPLGLNFFQVIATIIDEFKEKLNQTQQQKQNQCPDLQTLIDIIHSDDLKTLLGKTSLTEQEKEQIDDNKNFSSEDEEKIDQFKKDKANIEKNTTEDSKKVLNQEKKEIDDLKEYLLKIKTDIEELTKNTSSAIKDYLERKKGRDERAKEFEMLKNIPSQNTEEWQSFIESAKEYGDTIDNSVLNKDERCIYCHQPLSKDAIKLVQAYAQFLNDQSQQNFKKAVDKISELKVESHNLATDFSFSESLNQILTDVHNEQKQNYKTLVGQAIDEVRKQKSILEKVIKAKIKVSEKFTLDLLKTDEKLEEISEKKQHELNSLRQSDTQKAQKISELEREIYKLEDKQNISKRKTKIEGYFFTCGSIQKYEGVNQAINTRGITELGSKAHDELLTGSIRKSFEDELKALGKDIEVSLEKTGAGKGSVRTKLKILGNDVRDILSDGEQKAVSLALFLAETESQNNKRPIVFDDPVTSVDHEVADFLAQKLLCLSLDRQIIIFTHNKLFYDSLVYWGNNLKDEKNNKTHHVCKNYTQKGCNGGGCHVYTYKVDREAKDKTGRIFEAQNESCSYYIKKAENEMKGDYSLSCVASYLKSAIEHYIDEKILNKQGLIKDKKVKDHIEWKMLKGLNPDAKIIDQLKIYWDDLSNRGTHLSANSSENPLKTEDLNTIITFLKS
ncbi:AAA family ATPase [Patescibacteria group bacterium]|nr:AAA family ATPase [Patescibacteria group bacterium]